MARSIKYNTTFGGAGRIFDSSIEVTSSGTDPAITTTSTELDYPGLFAKSYDPNSLHGAPWQGVSAMISCDGTGGGGNIWAALAVDGLGDISAATYSEAALNVGVWGDSEGVLANGATHPIGTLGTSIHTTLGAGVVGVRATTGTLNLTSVSTLAAAAGVFGYSNLTAGVLGYTATADLPGVQGGAGHADGLGVHGYAGAVTPAAEASSWSGAGVAGSSKVAGKYGVGGEYLNTASYGEGVEGWNGANGSGVAGYCAATTGDLSVGVWGQAWSTTTSGAGVMGAKGSNNALPNITNALMGGVGVFGYSEYTAGVYGYSGAAAIPGIKADAYVTPTTAASHAIHARKGAGANGTAIYAGPRTGTYSTAAGNIWNGSTSMVVVDSDIDVSNEWVGFVSWSPRTTGWVAGVWGEVNNGPGIWGKSRGGGTYADDAYGVVGELQTGLTNGAGVLGISHFSSYAPASSSAKGAGVVGCSDLTAGVLAISNATGVPGLLASGLVGDANGVVGIGHGQGVGGVFVSSGINHTVSAWGQSAAVFAKAAPNANVSIYALGPGGATDIAIEGDTSTGIGVYGYSGGTGNAGYFECDGSAPALIGDSQYGTGYGIIARADSTTPVKSAFRIHPQDTAPSSPAEGDVYANSVDHKLYFYNGSGWQALF